jgi:putative SOS response-associated peptidase YedK
MCGRFVSATPAADLAAHFGAVEVTGDLPPRFNVAPSSEVWVIRDVATDPPAGGPAAEACTRTLGTMRWGLVPSWATDPAIGSRLINARVETAATKPSFRAAFRRRRCLLPADGFYEWAPVPGQRAKQPWYFTGTAPLALAGLWEDGHDASPPTCTILTTAADDVVAPVHHRMPVVLAPSTWDTWLDPGLTDAADLEALVAAAESTALSARRVGTAVGNPRNDGPALIEERS